MSDNLPPLPEPAYSGPDGTGNFFNLYTAAQVEEIRRAAVLAERERCAKVAESMVEDDLGNIGSMCLDVAAAIREGDK